MDGVGVGSLDGMAVGSSFVGGGEGMLLLLGLLDLVVVVVVGSAVGLGLGVGVGRWVRVDGQTDGVFEGLREGRLTCAIDDGAAVGGYG